MSALGDMWKHYMKGVPKGTPLLSADDLLDSTVQYKFESEAYKDFQVHFNNPAPSQADIDAQLEVLDWISMLPRWERELVSKLTTTELQDYYNKRKSLSDG